ncbi:hypothetical protein ACH4GM_31475 [Streptomyces coeruleorubidus]|uniref:hypothetical protein n=1 Tax=Streptomyces coeruleorubidus TaxID=116188 RepID=UPI00379F81E0
MADITQIRAKIEVANLPEAGSDDWVYLGIAGREFVLDSGNADDFDKGTKSSCWVSSTKTTLKTTPKATSPSSR